MSSFPEHSERDILWRYLTMTTLCSGPCHGLSFMATDMLRQTVPCESCDVRRGRRWETIVDTWEKSAQSPDDVLYASQHNEQSRHSLVQIASADT